MRKTKYVPGHGYITQYGQGFWQDAGKDLAVNVGKNVIGAIGDRIGRAIAKKIVPEKKSKKSGAVTREDVMKELKLLPESKEYGLPDEVRKALYGKGVRKAKYLI